MGSVGWGWAAWGSFEVIGARGGCECCNLMAIRVDFEGWSSLGLGMVFDSFLAVLGGCRWDVSELI